MESEAGPEMLSCPNAGKGTGRKPDLGGGTPGRDQGRIRLRSGMAIGSAASWARANRFGPPGRGKNCRRRPAVEAGRSRSGLPFWDPDSVSLLPFLHWWGIALGGTRWCGPACFWGAWSTAMGERETNNGPQAEVLGPPQKEPSPAGRAAFSISRALEASLAAGGVPCGQRLPVGRCAGSLPPRRTRHGAAVVPDHRRGHLVRHRLPACGRHPYDQGTRRLRAEGLP